MTGEVRSHVGDKPGQVSVTAGVFGQILMPTELPADHCPSVAESCGIPFALSLLNTDKSKFNQ